MIETKISQRMYLQMLCNKFGDFKVAKSWRDNNGEHHWTKHYSIMQLWETEWGLRFLEEVNHRQILSCEIVFDIDTKNPKQDYEKIIKNLDEQNIQYRAFFSGSKGYHIHILEYSLTNMSVALKTRFREFLIKSVDCDVMKKSDKSMIALEFAPHWKTGKEKVLLKQSVNHKFPENWD